MCFAHLQHNIIIYSYIYINYRKYEIGSGIRCGCVFKELGVYTSPILYVDGVMCLRKQTVSKYCTRRNATHVSGIDDLRSLPVLKWHRLYSWNSLNLVVLRQQLVPNARTCAVASRGQRHTRDEYQRNCEIRR